MAEDDNVDTTPLTEPSAPPSPPPPPPAPAAEPQPDWRDKEIAAKHRQLKERDEQLAVFRAENERLKQLAEAAARNTPSVDYASPPPPPPPRGQMPEIDFDKRVNEKAAELLANVQATNLEAQLKSEYANDYEAVIGNFRLLDGAFQLMFNEIMATDDPAYVTATLGKNPEEIRRIRDLPGAKRQAALIKIGLEKQRPATPVEPARRPSNAPPPPTSNPTGGALLSVDSDNLYDERYQFKNYYAGNDQIAIERERDNAWFARRLEQKRNSAARPWSPGGKVGIGGKVS